jgi:hypothetical protein
MVAMPTAVVISVFSTVACWTFGAKPLLEIYFWKHRLFWVERSTNAKDCTHAVQVLTKESQMRASSTGRFVYAIVVVCGAIEHVGGVLAKKVKE